MEAAAAKSKAARDGSAMAAVEALLCSPLVATETDPTFVARPEAISCCSERCRALVRVGGASGDEVLEEYCSIFDASRKLGLAMCSVSDCLNGHCETAKGHRFR